jgi:hypothetical protein
MAKRIEGPWHRWAFVKQDLEIEIERNTITNKCGSLYWLAC